MLNKLPIIGVMGSGTEDFPELTQPLGALLAQMNVHLLTGGGGGTMTGVGKAFVEAADRRGMNIGIIPTEHNQPKAGYPNAYVEIPIITPLGTFSGEDPAQISRNHANVMTADALIILPGAKGTINEATICRDFGKAHCYFGAAEQFADFPQGPLRFDQIAPLQKWLTAQIA